MFEVHGTTRYDVGAGKRMPSFMSELALSSPTEISMDKLRGRFGSRYGVDFLLDALGLSSIVTLSILPVKTNGIA